MPSRLVLLGHPVAHSLSAVFQNAALKHAGIEVDYVALDVRPENLAAALRGLVSEGAAGNVTVPHKHAVAALCDSLSETAARTEAVNTFWSSSGRLFGDNTDVAGFDAAVRHLLGGAPGAERVAIIGAGGAASAVLAAIEKWPHGTRAVVFNRSAARLDALARRYPWIWKTAEYVNDWISDATLVVNATPVGIARDDSPLPASRLPAAAAVLDLVYRPGETRLVREARALGLRAADGRVMLLEQGALAFTQWFGHAPDRMVMREALERAIIGG